MVLNKASASNSLEMELLLLGAGCVCEFRYSIFVGDNELCSIAMGVISRRFSTSAFANHSPFVYSKY